MTTLQTNRLEDTSLEQNSNAAKNSLSPRTTPEQPVTNTQARIDSPIGDDEVKHRKQFVLALF